MEREGIVSFGREMYTAHSERPTEDDLRGNGKSMSPEEKMATALQEIEEIADSQFPVSIGNQNMWARVARIAHEAWRGRMG